MPDKGFLDNLRRAGLGLREMGQGVDTQPGPLGVQTPFLDPHKAGAPQEILGASPKVCGSDYGLLAR